MDLSEVLSEKTVCVCVGPGGVGKTTVSAAIALEMAQRGRRVAVVTIDPARRLADSLGLGELGNEPRRVQLGGVDSGGELWAMMLDVKRTFDEVIARLAPDEATRDDILGNRIYRELSSAVAGSQEYTAMSKLYDLDRDGRFDAIVLDTPPSRHALDFLEAPDRLTRFLEGRALQLLLRPTGMATRVVGRGTGVLFSVLRRATGVDLLEDVSVFFGALGGLVAGFRERAEAVDALLADERTAFVLVCSPQREPVDEAVFLARRLRAAGLGPDVTVVNRVHAHGGGDWRAARRALEGPLRADLAGRVAESFADHLALARRDARNVTRLEGKLGEPPAIELPDLGHEVCDLAELDGLSRILFAPVRERQCATSGASPGSTSGQGSRSSSSAGS